MNSINTNTPEYLFLSLSLDKSSKVKQTYVTVNWQTGSKLIKFTVGESYLQNTVIVNPFNCTLFVETATGEYRLQNNSIALINTGEKFIIKHQNNSKTNILLFYLGDSSIENYYKSLASLSNELNISTVPCKPLFSDACKIIRNEEIINNLSRQYINNFNELRYEKLYEDGLENSFISFLANTKAGYENKINKLKFKKRSTKEEVYKKIHKSLEYMEDTFRNNISLDELSKQANISKYHYLRLFKDLYSATPSSYLNQIRISNAKNVLSETDMPISDISHNLGFENLSHFSMKFKKITGLNPTDFRARYKKSNII